MRLSSRFIITGACGFIGSHLAKALIARGDYVIGIDNFDPFYDRKLKLANIADLDQNSFQLIDCDIRNTLEITEIFKRDPIDCVFHIAALAGVRPSIEDPARYASVNIDGLLSVLEAARSINCNRFIFASSSSVYGDNKKVPFAETDPVDEPISPYAATKRSGELICHTYSKVFGLSIACLRFFTVFGPAQRPDLAISKFMHMIDSGKTIPMFGDGSTSRDYTYIDDIIQGVLAANDFISSTNNKYRIFNLGGSKPITLKQMIDKVAKVVGKPAKIEQLPMQTGDVLQTFADLTRSKADLGFDPQTSFEEGLQKQWEWVGKKATRHQGIVASRQ
ncbi:MAG: GDP-mannose 4,6-dehydratase [Planctomycetes bacterium]|nr:GDP-mannose 4,6-dehydratase [Planctomycetota bacterium]